ncbi:MAG: selenocysteine-specific translation elongation factor [Fimbriimonadia bacterium]|nr:selenocysteine-specific translation elongation factor [Fimbriimonadia bacterium]
MKKNMIVGTAGHVDHGKTHLIHALTGINPDRLKEEQERGMTIDLGFANLPESEGIALSIIDVPGHERFLKNMLVGATGIDLALLVVDSEEGVMPQTREHAAILELLGVEHLLVALTKSDKVDSEWAALVEEQTRDYLNETPWQNAPIIRVSALSGEGLDTLKRALYEIAQQASEKPLHKPARLPIDRVFTMTGFGTVVTGTLISGSLSVGQEVELLPKGLPARVRGLQAHNEPAQTVRAGQRTAVNLSGIEKERVERGDVLVQPGAYHAVVRFNAQITLLKQPIAHGESAEHMRLTHQMRIRLHAGASEAIGRVYLLQPEPIELGQTGFAQIRLEEAIVLAEGDRFILRRYSPLTTLGGGVALDIRPKRYRRHDPALLSALATRQEGSDVDRLLEDLKTYAEGIKEGDWLRQHSDLSAERLESLTASGSAITAGSAPDRWWFHPHAWRAVTQRFQTALQSYHKSHPLKAGILPETLRSQLRLEKGLFDAAMQRLSETGACCVFELISLGEWRVKLCDFEIRPNPKQAALFERVFQVYLDCGFLIPVPVEVSQEIGAPPTAIQEMLNLGVEMEQLTLVGENLYYPVETLQELTEITRKYIIEKGAMTAAEFRDLTQSSRKYAVPLLEYFDKIGFTTRQGDARVLNVQQIP